MSLPPPTIKIELLRSSLGAIPSRSDLRITVTQSFETLLLFIYLVRSLVIG